MCEALRLFRAGATSNASMALQEAFPGTGSPRLATCYLLFMEEHDNAREEKHPTTLLYATGLHRLIGP